MPTDDDDFLRSRLRTAAADIELLLDQLFSELPEQGEIFRPKRLLDAIRYSSLEGGKRIRPFLTIESATLFGAPRKQALIVGAAIECVHSFSLVHDDLPSIDNDDTRRGRDTTHKKFDEATALMAGDALLTFAFDLLSRSDAHPDPRVRINLVSALARTVGVGGMVGGEMLDIAAEGRFADKEHGELNEHQITTLQKMKTGALLRFACISGAILGNAPVTSREAIGRYADSIGQAFQISDDLLDLEGDEEVAGKKLRKDYHKATFVKSFGPEGARKRLDMLVTQADAALDAIEGDTLIFRKAARHIAYRSK